MFDPRDDTRDRGEDGRERAHEGRDQTGDPRDVFLHDVDLPLEREREYVLDRDHVCELNGDDARTSATVGAFRVRWPNWRSPHASTTASATTGAARRPRGTSRASRCAATCGVRSRTTARRWMCSRGSATSPTASPLWATWV